MNSLSNTDLWFHRFENFFPGNFESYCSNSNFPQTAKERLELVTNIIDMIYFYEKFDDLNDRIQCSAIFHSQVFEDLMTLTKGETIKGLY